MNRSCQEKLAAVLCLIVVLCSSLRPVSVGLAQCPRKRISEILFSVLPKQHYKRDELIPMRLSLEFF